MHRTLGRETQPMPANPFGDVLLYSLFLVYTISQFDIPFYSILPQM